MWLLKIQIHNKMCCPNPKCGNKENFTELYKSNDDTIDKLNHSHMKCNVCGKEFNHWNESVKRLKSIFGIGYTIYK